MNYQNPYYGYNQPPFCAGPVPPPAYYPGYQQPTPYGYPPNYGQYPMPQVSTQDPYIPYEQSYVENILRLNRGKLANVYMNFDNGSGVTVFRGTVEAAGRDHLILSDRTNNTRYLLLTVYLLYVTFNEEINYYYPYTNEYNIPQDLRDKE